MKKIKILFIDHTPFLGGGQLRLISHLCALDKTKFDPIMVSDKDSGFNDRYQIVGVRIRKIHLRPLKRYSPLVLVYLLRSVVDFKRLIQEEKPDLILANTTRALIITALAKGQTKLTAYIRDYDYPNWLLKILSARIDYFLLISQAALNHYSLPPNKAKVVYLGSEILTQLKAVTDSDLIHFKAQLGLKPEDLVIGFVGRLVENKGPEVLLEAFSKLSTPKTKLIFFGTGQGQSRGMEEKLRQRIKELKLGDRVKIVGFIEDLGLIYKTLDIYVLPSIVNEGFPTTIIEAALAKVPIIATQTGGTSEFIKNDRNGLLVDANNIDQLTNSLNKLLESKKLVKRLTSQAFLDAQPLTETKVTQRMEKLYLDLLS